MRENCNRFNGAIQLPAPSRRELSPGEIDAFRASGMQIHDLDGLIAERRFLMLLLMEDNALGGDLQVGIGILKSLLALSFMIAIHSPEGPDDVQMKVKALHEHADILVPDRVALVLQRALAEDIILVGPENLPFDVPPPFPVHRKV